MSIYAIANPAGSLTEDQKKKLWANDGKKPFFWLTNLGFKDLGNLDKNFFSSDRIQYLTIEETFWQDYGYIFTPGVYEGDGFCVEVSTQALDYRGGKEKIRDRQQEVSARFDSLDHAIEFWRLLRNGDILPTRPLCRELSLTEQAYANQASLAVANSAEIRELRARVDQLMNHMQHLEQQLQGHLTPNNA